MREKTHQTHTPQQVFDFIKMFNQLAVLDEELASLLPEDEFELKFDEAGGIYINNKPLGVNVKQRYKALHSKRGKNHLPT
jgi:hypothetical protein